MTTWFSADHHFLHDSVRGYDKRPYSSVEEMNRDLIQRHNSLVKKEDTIYFIGDFSLKEAAVPLILPQLNGKVKKLVMGNHDKPYPHKKKEKAARAKVRYLEYGFDEVVLETTFGPFLLNHLPYIHEDNKTARFQEQRPKNKGGYLIHGHVHCRYITKDKMINVGVPVWDYRPVQYDTLL